MFHDYSQNGIAMLKSLVMFDQEDNQTHFRTDEFVFGDQILVCPIQEPNAQGRRMYIPRGKWYNFWTDEVVEGGKEKWVAADIDSVPMFIKEGAIIPKYPVQQYVGEKEIDELVLDVYFKDGIENSKVYEDGQDGYDYTKGRYSMRKFNLKGKPKQLSIQQHKDGTFITSYKTFEFKFYGLPFEIDGIVIDNEKVNLNDIKKNGSHSIVVDKNFTTLHITGK
jgi:alpha-glucosidase